MRALPQPPLLLRGARKHFRGAAFFSCKRGDATVKLIWGTTSATDHRGGPRPLGAWAAATSVAVQPHLNRGRAYMAISKRLRFEVFKRDNFTCVYCGRQAPEVVLEADHRQPRSQGGKDVIANLVTACFDCNRGKGPVPLYTEEQEEAANLAATTYFQPEYYGPGSEPWPEEDPGWLRGPRNRYHINLDPEDLYLAHVYGRKAFTYHEFDFDKGPF